MVCAKLAVEQWNWLIQKVATFELPEKVGDATYDFIQRRLVRDELSIALRELKAYSPWAQKLGKDNRIVFGPLDCWKQKRDEAKNLIDLELLDPERLVDVTLSEDSVSGILWMLTTFLTPPTKIERGERSEWSHELVLPLIASGYIWPILQAIKKVGAVREALGLNSSDKKRKWGNDDSEPAAQNVEKK